MQKKWNILIIPNTCHEGYNLTFSSKAVKTGMIVLCGLVLLGSVFCVASLQVWKKRNLQQVSGFKKQIEQQQGELASLKNEYAAIIVLEEKLRTIAGLKPRHTYLSENNDGGQGGPAAEETVAFDATDEFQAHFMEELQHVSASALRQGFIETKDSLCEIFLAFEKEQHRLANIPSINPVASPDAWISSGYGYRRDPMNGRRSFHEGLDIVAPRKTPVIAPAEGVVTFAGWHAGLGHAVMIRHGYGYQTAYGHNDKLMVKKGDRVVRGDVIALVGSTGRSTGPHVHYEVRLNNKLVNPYQFVFE